MPLFDNSPSCCDNGSVHTVTDPKDQDVESAYDRANRITRTEHYAAGGVTPDETREFTYDSVGNVLTLSDIAGDTVYVYDELYRVVTETRTNTGENPYLVASAYDLRGNRRSVLYNAARQLTSVYDAINRLLTVTDSVGDNVTTYAYDHNGNRLSCAYPNGVMNSYTYDALNRVLTSDTTEDATTIYSCDYTYDLVGNRKTIDEGTLAADGTYLARNLQYLYDNRYQLKEEAWGGTPENPDVYYRYNYDLAGNRTAMFHSTDGGATQAVTDYTYNVRNEIGTATKDGATTTYTHDENGNREKKSVAGGDVTDYWYDTNDRLVAADVNFGNVFAATYDYRTRRVTKTENGTVTTFRYDGGVSFEEIEGGNQKVFFVRGSGMGGGIGSILYSDRPADDREYFVYNAVGHTVATVMEDASVKSSNLYEAFGNIVSSSGTSNNNRLANTKERDASIGLDNHGFRYYDPEIGRYATRDPIGYGDGPNVYLSVHSNPINFVDPLGLTNGDAATTDTEAEEAPERPEACEPSPPSGLEGSLVPANMREEGELGKGMEAPVTWARTFLERTGAGLTPGITELPPEQQLELVGAHAEFALYEAPSSMEVATAMAETPTGKAALGGLIAAQVAFTLSGEEARLPIISSIPLPGLGELGGYIYTDIPGGRGVTGGGVEWGRTTELAGGGRVMTTFARVEYKQEELGVALGLRIAPRR